MKNNALSIANYFIELAENESKGIRPLKLMKLVYIAHGYILAILDKSALDPRFDKVEAWKFGPVIPSVYHSFKIYGNENIRKKTSVFKEENPENDFPLMETPELNGDAEKEICEFVWRNYGDFSGSDLVTMLHRDGTPWSMFYKIGQNVEIPDYATQKYYKRMVELIKSDVK